ncbi:MAG: hypothetical protein JSW33_03760 [bacterium]|nr:MAG: hypothetical protein JSW33_03760 [bacterium]
MKNRISRKNIYNQDTGRKSQFTAFFTVMLVPVLLAFLWVTITPVYWLFTEDHTFLDSNSTPDKILHTPVNSDSSASAENQQQYNDLLIEKVYWENKLLLCKNDSISLSIDLVDSLILLEIQGVIVRTCKIERYELNWSLRYFREHPKFLSWLGTPFILQEDSASITKVPVKVIHAPKNPIDAAQLLQKILPKDDPFVEFELEFNRNLRFHFQQNDTLDSPDHPENKIYYSDILSGNKFQTLASSVKEYFPSQMYQINIVLPRNDARAIYRALPSDARLALRM